MKSSKDESAGSRLRPWTPGERVSVDVAWRDGRVTRMSGTLLLVRDGEAYVETELGDVVGPEDSLEREDG